MEQQQFKVHVERIVRPIRAAFKRKNKMREELLAHLVQKFEVLVEEGLDEADASARAIQQLGDPDALRADLQASVPALERLAYVHVPNWRFMDAYMEKDEGESTFHFAATRTAVIGLGLAVFLIAVLSALWAGLIGNGRDNIGCSIILAAAHLSTTAAFFAALSLADLIGLRRVMSKETSCSALSKGSALGAYMCVQFLLIFVPVFLVLRFLDPSDAAVLVGVFTGEPGHKILLGVAVFVVVASFVSGFAMKCEHEQWAKWGRLQIDD